MDLPEFIEKALHYGITSERLVGAIRTLNPVAEALGSLAESDLELAPEISSAMNHLGDLNESLGRASTFLTIRYEMDLQKMRAAHGIEPIEEGATDA